MSSYQVFGSCAVLLLLLLMAMATYCNAQTQIPISEADKEAIVAAHNMIRSEAEATDMLTMVGVKSGLTVPGDPRSLTQCFPTPAFSNNAFFYFSNCRCMTTVLQCFLSSMLWPVHLNTVTEAIEPCNHTQALEKTFTSQPLEL